MPAPGMSWGRYPRVQQNIAAVADRYSPLPNCEGTLLPYGNGRSYGDSCLNADGWLLHTRGLDRFIAFDSKTGVLKCEAGVLLSEVLELCVPRGWFLSVTPGTKYVTVGGAIANDVHGKNHHKAGSFGAHVRRFELLRSDGKRLPCSPSENQEWFSATIGGLGLTGLITWAEIQLRPIAGPYLEVVTHKFRNLDEFFALSTDADPTHEYTVAWVDCLASGESLGRGLFMCANHSSTRVDLRRARKTVLGMPFTPPISLVNHLTLRVFNSLYYHRYRARASQTLAHYEGYFYPLDSIRNWNRIYGPDGLLQYQCVIPHGNERDVLDELLRRIATHGTGSFLAVLKRFGSNQSTGMLSFPRPGVTLALDFPNSGGATFRFLDRLDDVVRDAGGAVYPAKDARMSGSNFKRFFPGWERFQTYVDPRFSSSFWRRVMG